MDFQPESIGKLITHFDSEHRIYNSKLEWEGLEDLTGNGNHMRWNKPQERLEAFFRRLVMWLDKYIWREKDSYFLTRPNTIYVVRKLSDDQINEVGRGLANRFNTKWTDIK